MSEANRSNEPFTVLDWLGVMAVGCAVLGLLAFPLLARSFKAMYADFGGALPLLTQFVLRPWAAPLLALLPLGLLTYGLRSAPRIGLRRAYVVGAFVLSLAVVALCVEGLYMPLVMVGEAIRAE